MRFGTVCSGIEAPSVAWEPLGWKAQWFSEIEAFPCAVLEHHHPGVPNLGDMELLLERDLEPVELLCGGTPCQSFSVAGLRGGMDDPRGNLAAVFCALAGRLRPRWVVWENVPGVLSSNGGRDFGSILGALGQLGYGLAYRVLDAQYFGLAQRRKRVFVVGYLGDWRRAAAVLLEPEGLRGDSPPSREAGEAVAGTIRAGAGGGCGPGPDEAKQGNLIANTVSAKWAKGTGGPADDECQNLVAHALRADGFDASEYGTGRGTPLVPVNAFDARQSDVIQYGDKTGPLDTDGHSMAVAFHENQRGEVTVNSTAGSLKVGGGKPGQGYPAVAFQTSGYGATVDSVASTMQASYDRLSNQVYGCIEPGMSVRRLTPRECERLQGFPDDYTLIPYRGKPASDGPRYKALGNSMAVPILRWIGRRIELMESAA